jgi:predicted ArsR family transcriptional regulator
MIRTAQKRMTHTIALILQSAMTERPCSYDDLAGISGLSKPTVTRWLKQLHAAGGVHIAAWGYDRTGRLFVALWAWGRGVDRPRPGQQRTAAERMKSLRAARKEQA